MAQSAGRTSELRDDLHLLDRDQVWHGHASQVPMKSWIERFPDKSARIAGWLYLAIILLGAFGEVAVRGSLVVSGDPAATARAIDGSPLLWRLGIAGDLLMHVLDLPVILIFYYLLRPVNRSLALLATLVNLVQTAVLSTNKLNLLLPMLLATGGAALKHIPAAQLQALSYVAIQAHGHGFAIGLVFFGVACLLRGFMIYRATFLPRTLGVLLALAGMSYLVNSFALLLAPAFAASIFPAVLLPALAGELSLCLWLIVMGVDKARWQRLSVSNTAPIAPA